MIVQKILCTAVAEARHHKIYWNSTRVRPKTNFNMWQVSFTRSNNKYIIKIFPIFVASAEFPEFC